jgi:succinoglycan biosynthesis transport protein ExoP
MTGTDGAVRLIRVYGVWIVLVTAVVIAAAVGMSMTAPLVYQSQAIVVVESRVRANTTPVAPDMGTEKELARSGVVVDPAARALGTTPGRLLEGLVVSVAPDANVLTFTYTHNDAATAQNRAESLAMAYVAYRNSGEAASAKTSVATTSTQHATLVTDAIMPSVPVDRPVWVDVGIGLAVGLLLGVGTALIRDRLSDRIRGRDDFERISGTTVLATVPRQRRRRRDGERPVILRHPESPAAESFRYLRSRLQPNLHGATTILVTSAGRGEGRTTTAANLAVAMAQVGLKVVLIDTDLRDPRMHTLFGDDNSVGLTSVLAGQATLEQALQETSVERLRLLAAGPATGDAGDLLAESRLRPLLDTLRATCDLVIFDSGPVLSVSDPIALAAVCEHVLLVGDYRRTTRRYVARALEELAEVVHGNVSAVLLNAPRRAGGLVPYGRPEHAGAKPIPGTAEVRPHHDVDVGVVTQAVLGSVAVPPPTRPSPKAAKPPVPTVYSSASASTPAGQDQQESKHPSDADLPGQAGDRLRRLTRRG